MKEEIFGKKKLSFNIERTKVDDFTCIYQYKFRANQWLESVDNPLYFGIEHNEIKERLIENLVDEFRIALNNVVFGEPAGRAYVEYLENEKLKNEKGN